MIRQINPDTVVKPASKYAQAVVHSATAERITISGQLGIRPDGTVEKTLEAQMEQAWANLFAIMTAAGFEKRHLIKATVFVTVPDAVTLYRTVRDRVMDGHTCASTFLQISGLASPQFQVEIEGEAVKG